MLRCPQYLRSISCCGRLLARPRLASLPQAIATFLLLLTSALRCICSALNATGAGKRCASTARLGQAFDRFLASDRIDKAAEILPRRLCRSSWPGNSEGRAGSRCLYAEPDCVC